MSAARNAITSIRGMLVFGVAGLVTFAGLGIFLVDVALDGWAYYRAPQCSELTVGECRALSTVQVIDARVEYHRRQQDEVVLELTVGEVRFRGKPAFADELRTGDRLSVESWRGRPVRVTHLPSNTSANTTNHPVIRSEIPLGLLLFTFGFGLLLTERALSTRRSRRSWRGPVEPFNPSRPVSRLTVVAMTSLLGSFPGVFAALFGFGGIREIVVLDVIGCVAGYVAVRGLIAKHRRIRSTPA